MNCKYTTKNLIVLHIVSFIFAYLTECNIQISLYKILYFFLFCCEANGC